MPGPSAKAVAALAGALALALASTGCRCSKKDAAPAASASETGPKILPPLSEKSWLVDLPVPGYASAKVAVPLGSVHPAPVVIALHGSYDRPEWQCGSWASITGGRPFVLCPTGVPRGQRFAWKSPDSTAKELRAALTALKKRFGEHVASGSVVLAGYGMGADHAIWIQKQESSFFAYLALVEGGTEKWSSTMAAAFGQRGGKRILLACSHDACVPNAQRARLFSVGAGLDVKLLTLPDERRALSPALVRALKKEWPWLATGLATP
jgi:poly(3-hydroxybutyrate) depolymerase